MMLEIWVTYRSAAEQQVLKQHKKSVAQINTNSDDAQMLKQVKWIDCF